VRFEAVADPAAAGCMSQSRAAVSSSSSSRGVDLRPQPVSHHQPDRAPNDRMRIFIRCPRRGDVNRVRFLCAPGPVFYGWDV